MFVSPLFFLYTPLSRSPPTRNETLLLVPSPFTGAPPSSSDDSTSAPPSSSCPLPQAATNHSFARHLPPPPLCDRTPVHPTTDGATYVLKICRLDILGVRLSIISYFHEILHSLFSSQVRAFSHIGFGVPLFSGAFFCHCIVYLKAMASEEPVPGNMYDNFPSRKPRILLAASGSVAAIKFESLCRGFTEWAEVRAVATKSSLHFIDISSFPKDVILYTDAEEWSSWNKVGDGVLHIELRKWADIMVIAPLSANTLAKIAGGLCDNLLTCVVRAWDHNKPLYVAPAMNTFMWDNPFTERHLKLIGRLGISLIPPITKRLACGDYGNGAMAEPSVIHSTVRLSLKPQSLNTC